MKSILKYAYFSTTEEFEKWQKSDDVIIRNIFPDFTDGCTGIMVVYTEVSNEIPS